MVSLNTNFLAPSGREEAWRFTPIKKLSELLSTESSLATFRSYELKDSISGVTLVDAEINPVSNCNDEAVIKLRNEVKTGQILKIVKNFEEKTLIRLQRISNRAQATGSRLQVLVEENAHAKLLIDNNGSVHLSEEIELVLHQGAHLDLIVLQEWENDSIHLGRHHAILAKDSTLNSIVVTLGGEIVRILPTVEYTGPGAFANLNGLYFATSGQHLEHRLHVEHGVANAKSRVNYKGALVGKAARTVWIGDVFIKANAEGTDTYELNRNLLLSDGARADSVPNLEIETGEIVGAGHASTTGKFDDEQLFYLMSRGIPMQEARQLVIRGFFNEIVALIHDETIEERLMSKIEIELSKSESWS